MTGLAIDDTVAGLGEAKKAEVYDHDRKLVHSEDAHEVSSSLYEPDGIHDGLEFPTEEEIRTLRRVVDAIPWAAYLIATVELAERFSFYGSQNVFTNYIQQPLPVGSTTGAGGANGQSGAFDLGQQTANGLNTFYTFWCYICPLFGAYIADTRWGRYKTICVSVVIAIVGHILMIVSSLPGIIDQKNAMAPFALSLVVLGIGTGGFKANISPLVAEQYKRTRLFIKTTKAGERVIVDPALTTASIYMYFYLFINIGALVGQISMTYAEKFVGFWLAFTLPTVVYLLCPLVLYFGRTRYITSPPTGSVLATALRLWRHAARGRWSWNPVALVRAMQADDFWENAKPSRVSAAARPAWMTFDDLWVDEVRRALKACTVFLWYPIYWLTYNQITTNLISQAATLDTHGIPNDVINNLDPLALIIFIPICDLLLYPALRRAGLNFSALKKITAGFFLGSMAMVWAGVVQHYVYKTSPCHYAAATCADAAGNALTSPLNVWIQTGAYVLIALSEILASITGLEYAFTKAPKNMRSLVMSAFLFMSAIAAAIGEAFNSLALDPLLVWNYGAMAVIAFVGGALFWVSARKLDREEDALNNLKTGHVEEQ
jgi:POT family proton-dependent oligopeptide transporter